MGLASSTNLIYSIQEHTSAPDSRRDHHACRVYQETSLRSGKRKIPLGPNVKLNWEEPPEHDSNGFLYCKQPPRLLEKF